MSKAGVSEAALSGIICRLRLKRVDRDHAFGEIHGHPATMALIGFHPFSVMFGFSIVNPRTTNLNLSADFDGLIQSDKATVSLEDGMAWLTLDDLRDESVDSVGQ